MRPRKAMTSRKVASERPAERPADLLVEPDEDDRAREDRDERSRRGSAGATGASSLLRAREAVDRLCDGRHRESVDGVSERARFLLDVRGAIRFPFEVSRVKRALRVPFCGVARLLGRRPSRAAHRALAQRAYARARPR